MPTKHQPIDAYLINVLKHFDLMMGSLSAILSFLKEALPSKGKTRARVGMDSNNTTRPNWAR